MRRLNSKLITNFISEKGNDPIHKTYVAYTPLDQYLCIAVSESYDNDVEINSARLAVETALAEFEKKPSMKRIKEYIACANQQLLLHSTQNKLKASLTILVTDYTRMRYGVCGNTKIHVFYENMISLTSETQTQYAQMQELQESQGSGEPDQAQIHNLTQYLGLGSQVKPFVSGKISLTENSSILISTSNLWGLVSDIECLDAYENAKGNEELLESLQELLLSRQEMEKIGSYTVAAINIEKTFKEDVQKIKKRKKRIIIWSVIAFCIAMIALIVILSIRAGDRGKMLKIQELSDKGTEYIKYGNYPKSLEQYEKAEEITDDLSLNNFQYIKRKKVWKESVADKLTLLTTLCDADTYYSENNYEEAGKLYTKVAEQSGYLGDTSISEYAKEKLEEVIVRQEIVQLIDMGDMYEATKDHESALKQYNQALDLLKNTSDMETRGAVKLKIYEIEQAQKELETAEQEEKEKEQAEAVNEKIIKIQVLLAGANNYVKEGSIEDAEETLEEIMSLYSGMGASAEETEKIYTDIATLEQAIDEAKVKQQEEENNKKIQAAQEYMLEAAEAAQEGRDEDAVFLYNKALLEYKELKVWNDQVEKIYEELTGLEQKAEAEAYEEAASEAEAVKGQNTAAEEAAAGTQKEQEADSIEAVTLIGEDEALETQNPEE